MLLPVYREALRYLTYYTKLNPIFFLLWFTHQLKQFYPAGPGVGEVFIFELQHERHPGGVGGAGVTASLGVGLHRTNVQ